MTHSAILFHQVEPLSKTELCRILGIPTVENNPDLLWLALAAVEESGGINEVRQGQVWLHLKPVHHPQRWWVIESAHHLSAGAQNALLKTLEEPPAHATVILTTDRESALLPTVRSRVVRISAESLSTSPDTHALPELLIRILESTPGKALEAVEEWDKKNKIDKREHAIRLIEECLRALRPRALSEPHPLNLRRLKFTTACADALTRNANVRLTFDWWALRLAKPRAIR